ncbi:hypothetical protein Rsub_04282 [Raphidocelis subcapitata]|uniref:Uncharacterized protein n=1 Tax=Raphidocelis subcapitata TaxID=307507 RepID=A0A2V0NXY3_9CHLO|nr:hypothetical protein Rsub_04282 [Raphidocelis subcapitata]|eukprot:GBF91542.1 hypothetical protein Rsub_04282 [Raphidocelis subcapitata]
MPLPGRWALLLLALSRLTAVVAIVYDPCSPIEAIKKGSSRGFLVGLAFWPGGTEADWGDPVNGLHPCNGTQLQANLTQLGVHFATYNARIDRLTVLKTTFPEELTLTARARAGAPLLVSAVAFRGAVRSEARYVVSGEPTITGGTGFVATLSLMARFDMGVLKYLQFYNLTCNDCGGWRSGRCISGTSCTLPAYNCTCSGGAGTGATAASPSPTPSPSPSPAAASPAPAESPAPSPSPSPAPGSDGAAGNGTRRLMGEAGGAAPAAAVAASPGAAPRETEDPRSGRRLAQAAATESGACNYTQFSYCAATVNLAYDGLDAGGAAFSTGSQVRKLNSYSLVALFARGKSLFFDFKDKYDNTMTDYWGKFQVAQQDVANAYSGNAEAGRVTGSA